MIAYLITAAPPSQAHKNSLPSISISFSAPSIFSITNTPFFTNYTRLLTTYNTLPHFNNNYTFYPIKTTTTTPKSIFYQHQPSKMRYSILAAPIALAASVSAATSVSAGQYATSYTTQVVSTLTTYCSSATSLSVNGKIITVTGVSYARFAALQ